MRPFASFHLRTLRSLLHSMLIVVGLLIPVGLSAQLIVYAPSNGTMLAVDSTAQIGWYWNQIGPRAVRIEYSVDSGRSWKFIDTAGGDVTSYVWRVPDDTTHLGKVRVTALDDSASGISVGLFSITSRGIVIIYPTHGAKYGERFPVNTWMNIRWWGWNLQGTMSVDYSLDSGATWRTIDTGLWAQSGRDSLMWNVGSEETTRGLIRVRVPSLGLSDVSNNTFVIVAPRIELLSPNGGELYQPGAKATARWTYAGPPGWIRLELSTDGGATWRYRAQKEAREGEDSLEWTVLNTRSHRALLRAGDINYVSDVSDSLFAIGSRDSSAITIAEPMAGDAIVVDSIVHVRWSTTGLAGTTINVAYSVDSGATFVSVALHESVADGPDSARWSVPSAPLSEVILRIRDSDSIVTALVQVSIVEPPASVPEIMLGVPAVSELTATPNPASREVTLRWNGARFARLEVLSLDGRVRKIIEQATSGQPIDLGTFDAGAYFVVVSQRGSRAVTPILVR